jgi:hypothetical protein
MDDQVRRPADASAADVRYRAPDRPTAYAALDLGTNNCRLLIACPTHDGFRVIDSFSRIIRLGEGITLTGRMSDAAMTRALSALSVCRDKIRSKRAARLRLIATEACRAAENGGEAACRCSIRRRPALSCSTSAVAPRRSFDSIATRPTRVPRQESPAGCRCRSASSRSPNAMAAPM